MKIQTSVILSENLLSMVDQLLEKDKTLSDFVEAALQHYIAQFKRLKDSEKDIEIINRNADYLNKESEDALQYQVEL